MPSPVMELHYSGTESELMADLQQLADVLAGKAQDRGGCGKAIKTNIGLAILGKVHESYEVKSSGGTDKMGITWPALSSVTLALRKIDTSARGLAAIRARVRKLSPEARQLASEHARRLAGVAYRYDRPAIRRALRILEKKRRSGTISNAAYNKKRRELTASYDAFKSARLVYAGAYALILRDTGILFNSLSPEYRGGNQVFDIGPNFVTVGSNVPYMVFHNSAAARKQKRNGTGPVLPRRQILPDDAAQIPADWMDAVSESVLETLNDSDFWRRFLRGRVS